MAGHSKWANIKHKKAAADKKRGKAFSKASKEIIMAAKIGGGDPESNPRLRLAISSAKAVNLPKDTIEKAIKKGCGELEGENLDELSYEGYGPEGVAIMVDCLSDNRNRTASEIRYIFSRNNGNLASSGAVAFMFHRKCHFVIEGEHADEDKLMELFFENDVDIESIELIEDGRAEVYGAPEAFNAAVTVFEQNDIVPVESSIVRQPETMTEITDVDVANRVIRLIDALEENEDSQHVYSNVDFSEEVLKALEE